MTRTLRRVLALCHSVCVLTVAIALILPPPQVVAAVTTASRGERTSPTVGRSDRDRDEDSRDDRENEDDRWRPASAPVLVSPSGEITATRPTFTWRAVSRASSYDLKVTDASGRCVFSKDGIEGTSFRLPSAKRLKQGVSYAWTARVHPGWCDWRADWARPLGFRIRMVNPAPAPAASMTVDPEFVFAGEPAVLSWTTTAATDVSIVPGVGTVALVGSREVTPSTTTTYTLTATGPGGSTAASRVVRVRPIPRPPAGSLASRYERFLPADAATPIDPQGYVLLHGRVLDISGAPLAGVLVSIDDRVGWGTARTGSDGTYSLPIEGGGSRTLRFTGDGFITAQRVLNVEPEQILAVDDVMMTRFDTASTRVSGGGAPGSVTVHTGAVTTDRYGTRAATLVFPGDVRAYAKDWAGLERELPSFTVRATEFASSTAMPAVLPAASAFTYCVELSVDEADNVRFSTPVTAFVDDFLGFGAGTPVPNGFFDRDRGVWVPDDDGVVVCMLDADGDGVTDALDANGDGIADDLTGDGSTADEVVGLTGPRFAPGARLWRVPLTHFSPRDFNYGFSSGARRTILPGGRWYVDATGRTVDCGKPANSTVTARSRVLHEDVPLAGTGLTLHYASSAVSPRPQVIEVAATGSDIPTYAANACVTLSLGGRTFSQVLPPQPDLVARFSWDGLDFAGQPMQGRVRGTARVSYTYSGFEYDYRLASTARTFGLRNGVLGTLSGVLTREGIVVEQVVPVVVDRPVTAGEIAPGWRLSGERRLDTTDPDGLVRSDGSRAERSSSLLESLSTGGPVVPLSGGAALESSIAVGDVAVDRDGRFIVAPPAKTGGPVLLAATLGDNLLAVDPVSGSLTELPISGNLVTTGRSTIYAATGSSGGVVTMRAAATSFLAASPGQIVAFDVDTGLTRVVAGEGTDSPSEGANAASCTLSPKAIAADDAGNLYAAEWDRIWQITPDGRLHLFAGGGGSTPVDGASALDSMLMPSIIACGLDGDVYFDTDSVVFCVDKTGLLRTVAGTGAYPSGDDTADRTGQSATSVALSPVDLACGPDGSLYVRDRGAWQGDLVHRVSPDGTLSTIAGSRTMGRSYSDGMGATEPNLGLSAITCDARGRIAMGITDPDGAASTLAVMSQKRLLERPYDTPTRTLTDADGIGHVFAMDDGRELESFDLLRGTTLTRFEYDSEKRLASVTDRFGNALTIERDGSGRARRIVSPNGVATALTYEPSGRLSSVQTPDGGATTLAYDSIGMLTALTDPRGSRFAQNFDADGRLTTTLDPDGATFSFSNALSPAGSTLALTTGGEGTVTTLETSSVPDATFALSRCSGGAATKSGSTGDGADLWTRFPGGIASTTKTQYDPMTETRDPVAGTLSMPSGLTSAQSAGHEYLDRDGDGKTDAVTTSSTLNGKTSTLFDDMTAGVRTATSPMGRQVVSRYDPSTLLPVSVDSPGLATVAYEFDPRGRLTSTIVGERTSSISYDASGNVAAATGPDGRTVSYRYDAAGRPLELTRPDGSSLS
ncbi:MAG: carboxypeptidase regulatory-like domain-containing protein, partial [Coriobacteriia bacterium]|nr:carboxypeptidase regulatory-like domain-containing protein [Coriobacteriia bacterium]